MGLKNMADIWSILGYILMGMIVLIICFPFINMALEGFVKDWRKFQNIVRDFNSKKGG
jgi:hypothetical protein